MVNIKIGEIRLGISDLGNVKVGKNLLGKNDWEKRIGKTVLQSVYLYNYMHSNAYI